MKPLLTTILSTLLLIVFTGNLFAQSEEDLKSIKEAENVKELFIKHNPELADLFLEAKGYIIFPEVKEGTYAKEGVGARGPVYENGKLTGMVQLTQADVGMELNDQKFMEVVFFEVEDGLDRLKRGNLQLVTEEHGVIVQKGETKNVEFRNGMTVVTMPKEKAQIDISVNGQWFDYDQFE